MYSFMVLYCRMESKTHKIMQLETDIYEDERVYKELDAEIENTKHFVRGGCTLDTARYAIISTTVPYISFQFVSYLHFFVV